MSISSAMSNFLVWRERRQARQDHERLSSNEDVHASDDPEQPEEEIVLTERHSSGSPVDNGAIVVETVSEDDDGDEEIDIENQTSRSSREGDAASRGGNNRRSSRRTITLAELEEERELARRRTSLCVLFAVFILFRLWIQALADGDFVLLIICMMGTSWTARFVRATREREEELDRLIADYHANPSAEVLPDDVRFLSFQAQLALAIMESQRQMAEGGYGGGPGGNTPGVSSEARNHWERFEVKESDLEGRLKGGHGSTDCGGKDDDEEEPHCSICLSEYEEGDKLVSLPCKHVYHEDCVSSWTERNTRCPLCNLDLESVAGDNASEDS